MLCSPPLGIAVGRAEASHNDGTSDSGRVSAKEIAIKKGKQPHPPTSAKLAKLTACVPFLVCAVRSFQLRTMRTFFDHSRRWWPSDQPLERNRIYKLYIQSHVAPSGGRRSSFDPLELSLPLLTSKTYASPLGRLSLHLHYGILIRFRFSMRVKSSQGGRLLLE